MKISALKKMVREAVRAELKQMEKRLEKNFEDKLNEALQGGTAPQQTTAVDGAAPRSDLSELRARFRASQTGLGNDSRSDYTTLRGESSKGAREIADDPAAIRPQPAGGPKPKVKEGITKTGEKYVSGENMLDWFKQEKGAQALDEHSAAIARGEKIDEYVNDIIGKKRLT